MASELCRDVAFEACRRGALSNVHELWALLEEVDETGAATVLDVGSGESVWWAWWSLGARVVAIPGPDLPVEQAGFRAEPLPSAVTVIDGDRRDPVTVRRVADQLGGCLADVVVLAGAETEDQARADWAAFAPMVRLGGLVVVHNIAHPHLPGVGAFWKGLSGEDAHELVASEMPMGYGLMMIHDTERSRRHG